MVTDYRDAAYYAASAAHDAEELALVEWQASGMADREAYGITLISEDDVIGGYDPDADYESAYGMYAESVFDPDYPLGR